MLLGQSFISIYFCFPLTVRFISSQNKQSDIVNISNFKSGISETVILFFSEKCFYENSISFRKSPYSISVVIDDCESHEMKFKKENQKQNEKIETVEISYGFFSQ